MADGRTRTIESAPSRPYIVVVEPDPLMRWSIETFLNERFEVRTASTVAEACAVVGRVSPWAVVVADPMPDGGADAIIRAALQANPRARVICTVAGPRPGTDPAARHPAGVRVIEKPFLLDSLAEML